MDSQVTDFRTCFGTDAGRRVLALILAEVGVFDDDLKTPEDMGKRNFGSWILRQMGICKTPESIMELTNKFMEMKADG